MATKTSKSAKMRKLYDDGMYISDIAKKLNVRPQFVYNVIEAYVGEGNIRTKVDRSDSWSAKFREEFAQGAKVSEVARKFNKSDSFVYSVYRKWKKSQ